LIGHQEAANFARRRLSGMLPQGERLPIVPNPALNRTLRDDAAQRRLALR